ncbi:MAG: hypothetical protein WAU91_14555, partial [Desulfatitalea sp.]
MVTSIHEQIKAITEQLSEALAVDRLAARQEIQTIQLLARQKAAPAKLRGRCERLERRLAQSAARRRERLAHTPLLKIDPNLPISA